VEEYVFRLYDVLAPARFVSGLISRNLAFGFAVGNLAIVLFGVWTYLARVRPPHASARGWAWFWVVLETLNGLGHVLFALDEGGYFPGVATAPLLLGFAVALAVTLLKARPIEQ
jgi:hypothetical protein